MKNFNTLEELREALMSEDGAVYKYLRERFRIRCNTLERYYEKGKIWEKAHSSRNHGFLWHIEDWTRYEKPKKIVKESFEGFVSSEAFRALKSNDCCSLTFSVKQGPHFKHKATITIEREVDDE